MKLPELTLPQSCERNDLFRKAVRAQLDLWSSLRAIEQLYGVESIELDDAIDTCAVVSEDNPSDEDIYRIFAEIERDGLFNLNDETPA